MYSSLSKDAKNAKNKHCHILHLDQIDIQEAFLVINRHLSHKGIVPFLFPSRMDKGRGVNHRFMTREPLSMECSFIAPCIPPIVALKTASPK